MAFCPRSCESCRLNPKKQWGFPKPLIGRQGKHFAVSLFEFIATDCTGGIFFHKDDYWASDWTDPQKAAPGCWHCLGTCECLWLRSGMGEWEPTFLETESQVCINGQSLYPPEQVKAPFLLEKFHGKGEVWAHSCRRDHLGRCSLSPLGMARNVCGQRCWVTAQRQGNFDFCLPSV